MRPSRSTAARTIELYSSSRVETAGAVTKQTHCRALPLLCITLAAPSFADWTDARCDIYPAGSDHTDKMIGCTFSQRQGYVTITREDGVTHDLAPVGDGPGSYRDQQGNEVRRELSLGDQGLVFRFPDESVFVYWSTAALETVAEVPLAAIEGG